MNIIEAWSVLGVDWSIITEKMNKMTDHKSRIDEINNMYNEAKKISKKLMVSSHPDVNPDDVYAPGRFKKIQEAFTVIETNTNLINKMYDKMVNDKIGNYTVVIK